MKSDTIEFNADLMRLAIPAGWSIVVNHFYDADPVSKDGRWIDNWFEGFDFTTIHIKDTQQISTGWENSVTNSIIIDVSWTTPNYVGGTYRAKLQRLSPDKVYVDEEILETSDRFKIRDTIEYWMNNISEYRNRDFV